MLPACLPGRPGRATPPDQALAIGRPSGAISMVSIATSLPCAFRSVPVILVGHALASVHTMVGLPDSSSRLIVTGTRWIVFILILLNQSQNLLSPLNTPFFMVTLLNFFSPGILIVV